MEEKYKNEVIKASKERALSVDEVKILYEYKYPNEYFKKEENEKKKLITEAINIELTRNVYSHFSYLGYDIYYIDIATIISRTLSLNRKKKIFNGWEDVKFFLKKHIWNIENNYKQIGWTVETDAEGDFSEGTFRIKVLSNGK